MSNIVLNEINLNTVDQDEAPAAQWLMRSPPPEVEVVHPDEQFLDDEDGDEGPPQERLRNEFFESLVSSSGNSNQWSRMETGTEDDFDASADNSESAFPHTPPTKSPGMSSLLAIVQGSLPSRQIPNEYDVPKLAYLSDTLLSELNKGIDTMYKAANRFRTVNGGMNTLDQYKIILNHAIKNLHPTKEQLKGANSTIRKQSSKIHGILTEAYCALLRSNVNARIGSNLYKEIVHENLDNFNRIGDSNDPELRSYESKEENQKLDSRIELKSTTNKHNTVSIEYVPKIGDLIIKNVQGDGDGGLRFSRLPYQQKLVILNAIFGEIKNLAEQSFSDLKELNIYFKPFKSTGNVFAKTLSKQHFPSPHERSMESHILQIRQQLQHKSNYRAYSHHFIESAFYEHLKTISGRIDRFIAFNERVGEYFRKQFEEIDGIRSNSSKLLKGKSDLKYNWVNWNEHVEMNLTSLGSSVLFRISPNSKVSSTSHGIDQSLVVNIGDSMDNFSDEENHDRAQNRNWFFKMLSRFWAAITFKK